MLAILLYDRLWAVEPVDSTPVMSALAMIVLWLLPLVALRPNRRDLFRLRPQVSVVLLPMAVAARFVAPAAIWIGTAAIIWPDDLGSSGIAWGAVLAGWGIAFAVCADGTRRRAVGLPTT